MKRLGVDAPAEWLAMAQEARRRQVPESDSGALGHRAFRAKLAAATSEAELKTLIEQIEAFFPDAAADKESGRVNLARWETAVRRRSRGHLSRRTPPHVRKGLDRRLWADATVRLLEIAGRTGPAGGHRRLGTCCQLGPRKSQPRGQLDRESNTPGPPGPGDPAVERSQGTRHGHIANGYTNPRRRSTCWPTGSRSSAIA